MGASCHVRVLTVIAAACVAVASSAGSGFTRARPPFVRSHVSALRAKRTAAASAEPAPDADGAEDGDVFAELLDAPGGAEEPEEEEEEGEPRLFCVFGRDRPSLEDVRFSLHSAHCEYLQSVRCGVYEAGYFLQDGLQAAAGTMYVIDGKGAQDAVEVAANDPFAAAGLFDELHVNEWVRLLEPELDNPISTPPFLIYCRDRADAGDLRARTREAHLEWLRGSVPRVVAAGPLLDPDPLAAADPAGAPKVGSLLLVCGQSLAEVRGWAEGDPYAQAGLFEAVTVAPWTSLAVTTRTLPVPEGPPLETWWEADELGDAPPLLVSPAELSASKGRFTADGALRTPELELQDARVEEASAALERWAETMERHRLGTERDGADAPLFTFEVDGDTEGLFWRETDEDVEAEWPFESEPEELEELEAASKRVPSAESYDNSSADGSRPVSLDAVDSDPLLDSSAPDTSLQDM